MGEGTKYATTGTANVRMKFIEQINYQEIDEGEVSFFYFVLIHNVILFSKTM